MLRDGGEDEDDDHAFFSLVLLVPKRVEQGGVIKTATPAKSTSTESNVDSDADDEHDMQES